MSSPPLHQRFLSAFLRIFFRLLYHQFAWTYDAVAALVSVGLWKQWVLSALPFLQGPRVLELGHGPGHLQVALHRRGVSSVGLDTSPQMGAIAFSRVKRAGFVPLLVNGYAQFMPFPAESFDQIIATFPSEYIRDPATLSEIYRGLAPGGELILLPIAWITGRGLLLWLARGLFRITGQAPEWNPGYLAPLKETGFSASTQVIELPSSRLLFVRAKKMDRSS